MGGGVSGPSPLFMFVFLTFNEKTMSKNWKRTIYIFFCCCNVYFFEFGNLTVANNRDNYII